MMKSPELHRAPTHHTSIHKAEEGRITISNGCPEVSELEAMSFEVTFQRSVVSVFLLLIRQPVPVTLGQRTMPGLP